jgi:GNAT superfamily N-acetyltransferase
MGSDSSEGFSIRAGTPADAEVVAGHRRAMFFDMGYRDEQWLSDMSGLFLPWVRRKMESGDYLAWFAVAPDGSIAAGAGLWLMEWMPHKPGGTGRRGNVLNVYTESAYRRRGLARGLMNLILEWARNRGIEVVMLHASDEGRPLYESMGFRTTNEMRIDLGK